MSDIGSVTYVTAKPVTPSDSVDDPAGPFMGFYTGSGGNISVLTENGDSATFDGTAAGIVIPCAILRVNETGTAATGILGVIARQMP